jgi:hypothetical protein
MNDTEGALNKKVGLLTIIFTIPSTKLPTIVSVFIPTPYMFQLYFWVIFKWYTHEHLNISILMNT